MTAALDSARSDFDEHLALGQNTHERSQLVPSAWAIVRTRGVSSFVRQFPHPSVFFREAARTSERVIRQWHRVATRLVTWSERLVACARCSLRESPGSGDGFSPGQDQVLIRRTGP